MVKVEEIIAEEAGGRGFMDMLGLGEEPDYLPCLSPSSDLSFASVCAGGGGVTLAAASPTCASYLAPPPHHRILSFSGQEHHRGGGMFGFQCYGGDQAIPVVVPQKSSPTAECSSSISSMSSSPPATAVQAASGAKPHAFKKKGSRAGAQRKTASPAATTTNKRPRVRREKLGERIIALQQLVSPFGKSDTASVLHEALGYIRFLHDQVQVLSSPYMQRLPPSARAPESAAAPAPRPGDLRNRGLCLVPVSCTEHVAGDGGGSCNGADMWSVAAGVAAVAEEIADEKAKKKRGGDLPEQVGQQLQ